MKISAGMDLDGLVDAVLGFATEEEACAVRDILVRHYDGQYTGDIPASVMSSLVNHALSRLPRAPD